MKPLTLEEVKSARDKGCRIETLNTEGTRMPWFQNFEDYGYFDDLYIHRYDEWKARLPRLKEGLEWAHEDPACPEGSRPYIVGEYAQGVGIIRKGATYQTDKPVPLHFRHEDELQSASKEALIKALIALSERASKLEQQLHER